MGNMSTELLDQVNQLRLEEDLTYLNLAEQIGVNAGALYRILNGKAVPIDRTLFKIRRFLEQRQPAGARSGRKAKGRAA
jgi:transcriptional regulator with XRE-family HTH domain